MKVALIGNMNNNYFSLMRYMRDNGVEADLLMFADEAEHFMPVNDTWEIEKWQPFIKQTNIFGGALSQFIKLSPAEIRKEFGEYDAYIGCGFTPAYFNKASMQLDIFTPYCVGIEYTYRITKTNWKHAIKEKIEAYYQKKGLRNNTKLLGTIDEESRVKANKLGIPTMPLPLLMIYNKENVAVQDDFLQKTIDKFRKHHPVIFSHVSHFPRDSRTYELKRNDVLIKGFAEFAKNTDSDPLLILFEYGEAVHESKALIKALNIEDQVFWLPLMSRKKIMYLLQHAHFGGGEFGGAVWGGTGWEFMASGLPFFQYVDMDKAAFKQNTQLDMPPFFNVSTPQAITALLQQYTIDESARKANGLALKEWFNREGGQQLAEKYISLAKK